MRDQGRDRAIPVLGAQETVLRVRETQDWDRALVTPWGSRFP